MLCRLPPGGADYCPVDCSYSKWTDWSACSEVMKSKAHTRKAHTRKAHKQRESERDRDQHKHTLTHKHAHTLTHARTHTHTHIHTHIHTHTHTHREREREREIARATPKHMHTNAHASTSTCTSMRTLGLSHMYTRARTRARTRIQSCGDGFQHRKRSIKYAASYGGIPCGDTYQKKNCFVTYCPVECDYEWGDWCACVLYVGVGECRLCAGAFHGMLG